MVDFRGVRTPFMIHRLAELGAEYGPVFSLKLGPDTMIVLNSRRAVYELVDKKGHVYSDRPGNYVAELVMRGENIAFMSVTGNNLWKDQRRFTSHNLAVSIYVSW
jgi:hypothetical protein